MENDQLVEYPASNHKVTLKHIKTTTYVYFEYDRTYNPDTQHTTPKRKCIGKLAESAPNMMIPNSNYVEYFGTDSLPRTRSANRSCTLSVGAFIVIEKIIQDYQLETFLQKAVAGNNVYAGLFLDFMTYEIVCGSNVAQHYPNYAYRHPLFTPDMVIYSDSYIGTMFERLTVDHRQAFLNSWNERRNTRQRIYVSYDSTNRHSTAGEIYMVEFGKSKDGNQDVPIVNQGIAYDCNYREPLFYDSYPGSVVDVNMIKSMVEKALAYGYRDIGFILDRGYFAKENLFFMDKHDYAFVIMAKGRTSFLRSLVEEAMGTFEVERSFLIRKYQVQGTTIIRKLFPDDSRDRDRWIHVFYNELEAAIERRKLEESIFKWETELTKCLGKRTTKRNLDSYNRYFKLQYGKDGTLQSFTPRNSAIEDEKFWFGYFCIVTSEKMTAKQALYLYKGRDCSEKLFMTDKTFLGNSSYRVDTQAAKDTKEWIGFVGEIVRNKLYTCLSDAQEEMLTKSNDMSVPAAIGELEKFEICRQLSGEYHIDYPLTKKQKMILSAFNLTPEETTARAQRLCDQMTKLEKSAMVESVPINL